MYHVNRLDQVALTDKCIHRYRYIDIKTVSNISQVIGGSQQRWPADRGSFLLFHMYKENRDTLDALHTIAKLLR